HTQALLVKVGDKVARGDAIALVGSSGRSTGPHVHVEVLRDGRPVNPAKYLRAAR
ncbi:MAG TPA: M23 family metallopeptidase, partial [Burkholderiales bacterium]